MKIFDAGQLRLVRRHAKLTLRDAAKSLFLAASSIVAKENGNVRVFADELTSFAELYGVSVENFFIEKVDSKCK